MFGGGHIIATRTTMFFFKNLFLVHKTAIMEYSCPSVRA